MSMTLQLSNIHWWPVLVVTILTFPLGTLWHSKALFGKAWNEDASPVFDKSRKSSFCDSFRLVGPVSFHRHCRPRPCHRDECHGLVRITDRADDRCHFRLPSAGCHAPFCQPAIPVDPDRHGFLHILFLSGRTDSRGMVKTGMTGKAHASEYQLFEQ